VPSVQERAGQLRQETCASGELCAPCYDPVNGGSTGACEINGDQPNDPDPGPFVYCQSTNAILTFGCLLPPPQFPPPADGRCVPDYIALASSGGDLLCRVTCANGELCAPCNSPLDGSPTGACP
jgi:hypothetical protein